MPACISSLSQNTGNNSTTLDGWHEQATTTTIIEHFVDANAVVLPFPQKLHYASPSLCIKLCQLKLPQPSKTK
jgi:hypothetical protein